MVRSDNWQHPACDSKHPLLVGVQEGVLFESCRQQQGWLAVDLFGLAWQHMYSKELFREQGQPLTWVEKNDIPQQRFCHMDLVVPLPTSCAVTGAFRPCLTPALGGLIIYHYWISLKSQSWKLSSLVGSSTSACPGAAGTSDWGALFTSGMWTTWCQDLQVEHITTTAFSPPGKQMVEVLCHQPKEALHAR